MTRDSGGMEEVASRVLDLLGARKPIVFVSGNFNILHPGHLRLLKFASEVSAALVVGVNSDDTPGVSMPQALRLQGVEAIAAVAAAVALTGAPEEFIARLKPDIVVKGKEYADRFNPEQAIVDAYGGRVMFSSGEVRFASKALLEREYSETQFSAIQKPVDYPLRNGFRVADLAAVPPQFSGLKVVVVGDLIVDEYISCDPLGMSQEDPTIVVTPIESKLFVGGAGIVAAHAHGLGAQTRFISICGEDDSARFARQELSRHGVVTDLFVDATRPTTLKQRYRALGKTLLRVNHLRQHSIEAEHQQRIFEATCEALTDADILLFADYNYGCLPQPLVEALIKRADRASAYFEATQLAGFTLEEGLLYFGAPAGGFHTVLAPLPVLEAQAQYLARYEALSKAAATEPLAGPPQID